MSDDEADPELVELLRQALWGTKIDTGPPTTKVLEHASFIYDNSVDVAIDMRGTKTAAAYIHKRMQETEYGTKTWATHELHPQAGEEGTVEFIFTMDLLNFSFWTGGETEDEWPEEEEEVVLVKEEINSHTSPEHEGQAQQSQSDEILEQEVQKQEAQDRETDEQKTQLGQAQDEKCQNDSSQNESSETAKSQIQEPRTEGEEALGKETMDTDLTDKVIQRKAPAEEAPQENGINRPAIQQVEAGNIPEKPTQVPELEIPERDRDKFVVQYAGKNWTGYWSLVAALRRALDEGIPITSPAYWVNEKQCNQKSIKYVFRSATTHQMPMLPQRLHCLREAGKVLLSDFDGTITTLITEASHSAARLTTLLASAIPSFADTATFERKTVHFYKRAQIFAADLWAAFRDTGPGHFTDIDTVTMFADYRIPQMLQSLGVLWYSPKLELHVRNREMIPPGSAWEVELRGCSVWAVELIRREIVKIQPDAVVNAILIDFFLYDSGKEREKEGEREELPHHRTRTTFY